MEQENKSNVLILLATPTGFEPVTPRLGISRTKYIGGPRRTNLECVLSLNRRTFR